MDEWWEVHYFDKGEEEWVRISDPFDSAEQAQRFSRESGDLTRVVHLRVTHVDD